MEFSSGLLNLSRGDTVVVSTHGLIKKSDKTPSRDLDKAERLRVLYFQQKIKKNEKQKTKNI